MNQASKTSEKNSNHIFSGSDEKHHLNLQLTSQVCKKNGASSEEKLFENKVKSFSIQIL